MNRRRFTEVGKIEGLDRLGKKGEPFLWLLTVPDMADDRDVRDTIYFEIFRTGSKIRNGIIVFDDMNDYEEGKISGGAKLVFSKRRQMGLEVFATFHGLNQVPPKIWTWNNFLVLWRTVENPESQLYKTPKGEEVIKAYEKLQSKPKSYTTFEVIEQSPVTGMDGIRERSSWLFIGTNGTGKSTTAINTAGAIARRSPGLNRFCIFICTAQPNDDPRWANAGRLEFVYH